MALSSEKLPPLSNLLFGQHRDSLPQQLFMEPVQPRFRRQAIGAELLQTAFLFVVEISAVRAEPACLRRVDQGAGILGAHLAQNTHSEFAQRLPVESARCVVWRIAG